jgi:hypothetical protein
MLADGRLPVSFLAVAHALRPCLCAPTSATFVPLMAGMICAPGRSTVTGMLSGAGLARSWSQDRAHEFFSTRAWEPLAAGELLWPGFWSTARPASQRPRSPWNGVGVGPDCLG